MEKKQIERIVPALLKWYEANKRGLPWRCNRDPYAVWISEIMLQQTQVKTVIPYFDRWLRALPTIAVFARARPEKILKLWEGLGYYSRVHNAQAAARLIVSQHGGRFPEEFGAVLDLPGIGRYTAGAICSIAFNQPVAILDGNVIRVLSRIFGVAGNPRDKQVNARLWELAATLVAVPGAEPSQLNQSLMELGALVCLPRQPKCEACPVRSECFAYREQRVSEFPALPPRPVVTHRHFIAFVVQRDGHYLVRQRPTGVVNGGLWEFPNVEAAAKSGDFTRSSEAPLLRVRHSITRYRILLEAFPAQLPHGAAVCGDWKNVRDLTRLAFTSAHRKIADFVART